MILNLISMLQNSEHFATKRLFRFNEPDKSCPVFHRTWECHPINQMFRQFFANFAAIVDNCCALRPAQLASYSPWKPGWLNTIFVFETSGANEAFSLWVSIKKEKLSIPHFWIISLWSTTRPLHSSLIACRIQQIVQTPSLKMTTPFNDQSHQTNSSWPFWMGKITKEASVSLIVKFCLL